MLVLVCYGELTYIHFVPWPYLVGFSMPQDAGNNTRRWKGGLSFVAKTTGSLRKPEFTNQPSYLRLLSPHDL